MRMTELILKLGRSDVKLIGRDRFLMFMFMFVVYLAVVLRYGLPGLNSSLAEQGVMPGDMIPISFSDTYPMWIAYFVIYSGALLVGTIFGFLLLDEKEHHTFKAMLVTPVSLSRYLLYRIGGQVMLAFFIIIGMMLIINLAQLPVWQLVLISAGGALAAPICSLFFIIFAKNKVQGFAYSKFGGVTGWPILIGFFVREPFQWIIGLFPPFWISKAYWMALESHPWWWAALILGDVLQMVLIYLMLRRFKKIAYR